MKPSPQTACLRDDTDGIGSLDGRAIEQFTGKCRGCVADFENAVSANHTDGVSSTLVERHTRDDPFWRIWVVLSGVLLLLNWFFTGQGRALAPTLSGMASSHFDREV